MYNNSRLRSSSGRGNLWAPRPTPQPNGRVFTLTRVRIRQPPLVMLMIVEVCHYTIGLGFVWVFHSSIPVRDRYEHGPSTTRDRKFFVFFFTIILFFSIINKIYLWLSHVYYRKCTCGTAGIIRSSSAAIVRYRGRNSFNINNGHSSSPSVR